MEIPEMFYVETPRDLLALTGRDRASFLQGMVTNDVLSLEPGQGCYAFHLDATGHVFADMRILVQEDRILLDLEPGVGPVLNELLDHYLVMERVKIAPWRRDSIFLAGSKISDFLTSDYLFPGTESWAEGQHAKFSFQSTNDAILVRDTTWGIPGFTLHESMNFAVGALDEFEGFTKQPMDSLELSRILAGVPRFGVDIDKRVLAPETGQAARAIHYKKGCYVGQEIVARIDARGHTNRSLAAFWLNAPVPAETPVTVGGKEIGRITSSAAWEGMAVALGYLRNELSAPGTEILAGETSGSVRELS